MGPRHPHTLCFITEADFMLEVKSLLMLKKGLKQRFTSLNNEESANTHSDAHILSAGWITA